MQVFVSSYRKPFIKWVVVDLHVSFVGWMRSIIITFYNAPKLVCKGTSIKMSWLLTHRVLSRNYFGTDNLILQTLFNGSLRFKGFFNT